jgi:hypothetical protein
LRSIADVNVVDVAPEISKRGNSINIVRYGIHNSTTTK